MALHQLLYTSLAVRDFAATELVELLEQSREKNGRLGITGMLLYYKQEFMQILEGEYSTVLDLYAEIADDSRHRQVRTFFEGTLAERGFGGWTMAFANLDEINVDSLAGHSEFLKLGFTSETLSDRRTVAQNLLKSLRDNL